MSSTGRKFCYWTGARVAEGGGLLSRWRRRPFVGSNPTPSASEGKPADKRGVATASGAPISVRSEATGHRSVQAGGEPGSRNPLTQSESGHPKAECICERCGRDYPIWHAENEAWNLAVNRTQEYGDEWQYLCPTCFVRLHEIATGKVYVWSLEVST